ncbi:MAG: 2Fe-2S iron-sulfur cluster-binding protein [Flavobacteriaceae bacterium]|nr:2Fe-2S iron-sulfur cluster-binding protein [Flavobacteriaceae bacterium]
MENEITLFITDRDGKQHRVSAPTDMNLNLMEVVRLYELAPEGTIGICGGMAMCASCQCYIESPYILPEKSDEEEAMLAEAFYVKENSRLGCQIHIDNSLNNLEVILAPEDISY